MPHEATERDARRRHQDGRSQEPEWDPIDPAEMEQALDRLDPAPPGMEPTRRPHDPDDVRSIKLPMADDPDLPGPEMPNVARTPGSVGAEAWESEALIVAIELAARLPDDVRLPPQAREVVPVVVEAAIRDRLQEYIPSEFSTRNPNIADLTFEDLGEKGIWMKVRIGIPREMYDSFQAHLDEIGAMALDHIETLFEG